MACFEDPNQELQKSGPNANEWIQIFPKDALKESAFSQFRDVTTENEDEVTFNHFATAEKVTSLASAPTSVPLKGPARFLTNFHVTALLQNLRLSTNPNVNIVPSMKLKQEPKSLVKILPRNSLPRQSKTVLLKPFPKPKTVCSLAILTLTFSLAFLISTIFCVCLPGSDPDKLSALEALYNVKNVLTRCTSI